MASTKLIPGFAKNLAQKFAASAEHIAYLMQRDNVSVFKADLIAATISTPQLDVRRNRILVQKISKNYQRLMQKYPDHNMIRAELIFYFTTGRQEVTVKIMESNGKSWSGTEKCNFTSNPLLYPYKP